MFTIKHITDNGEALFSAQDIGFDSRACGSDGLTLNYTKADRTQGFVTGGTVYVMNEAGKTVSTYNLSLPTNPPLERSGVTG